MNVLILMGSPKLQGNTAELCKPFMEEMNASGAQVRYVTLADKDIKPCRGAMPARRLAVLTAAPRRMRCRWRRSYGRI